MMRMKRLVFGCCLMLPAGVAACGSSSSRETTIAALTGDTTSGRTLYLDQCVVCHGDDGASGTAGEDITGEGGSERILVILDGGEGMPSFSADLSDQDIADVVAYIDTL